MVILDAWFTSVERVVIAEWFTKMSWHEIKRWGWDEIVKRAEPFARAALRAGAVEVVVELTVARRLSRAEQRRGKRSLKRVRVTAKFPRVRVGCDA